VQDWRWMTRLNIKDVNLILHTYLESQSSEGGWPARWPLADLYCIATSFRVLVGCAAPVCVRPPSGSRWECAGREAGRGLGQMEQVTDEAEKYAIILPTNRMRRKCLPLERERVARD
jgi:hypothetical protein